MVGTAEPWEQSGGVRPVNTRRYTKSVYFLLPMLGKPQSDYPGLVNVFIGDVNRPQYGNYYLFILVRQALPFMLQEPGYVEHYEVPHEGIMYVMQIPQQYEEDYLKFLLGKYSQFSPQYKHQITRLLPVPYQSRRVFQVITKSPEARAIIEEKIGEELPEGAEVMSVPDMNKEIYY